MTDARLRRRQGYTPGTAGFAVVLLSDALPTLNWSGRADDLWARPRTVGWAVGLRWGAVEFRCPRLRILCGRPPDGGRD